MDFKSNIIKEGIIKLNFLHFHSIKDNKGLSLIEIIIVGILASILTMMALANFSGFYRASEFERRVEEVVSFIREVQTNAVSQWRQKNLLILTDENRLFLGSEGKNLVLSEDYIMESDAIMLSFGGVGGFDCVDAKDPTVANSHCWIKIKRDSTGEKAKIDLWGYAGYIDVKSKYLVEE